MGFKSGIKVRDDHPMSVNTDVSKDLSSSIHLTQWTLSVLVGPVLGILSGMHWMQQQSTQLGQYSESVFAGRTLPRLPFPKG
jgi:hypothetical protein